MLWVETIKKKHAPESAVRYTSLDFCSANSSMYGFSDAITAQFAIPEQHRSTTSPIAPVSPVRYRRHGVAARQLAT